MITLSAVINVNKVVFAVSIRRQAYEEMPCTETRQSHGDAHKGASDCMGSTGHPCQTRRDDNERCYETVATVVIEARWQWFVIFPFLAVDRN